MIEFHNPFTAGRTIRERDERIAQLEAEAARQEQRECDVFLAYVASKRLQRMKEEEQD